MMYAAVLKQGTVTMGAFFARAGLPSDLCGQPLGWRYLADDAAAPAVADPPVAPEPAPAAPEPLAPQPAADDTRFVRIPRDSFKRHSETGDYTVPLRKANDFQDLVENGYMGIIDRMKREFPQMTPDQIADAIFIQQGQQGQPAQQPYDQQQPYSQPQDQQQPQYMTAEQVQQMIDGERQSSTEQRDYREATAAENKAHDAVTAEILTDLGMEPNLREIDVNGVPTKADPNAWIVNAFVKDTAQRLHEQTLDPNKPDDFRARQFEPITNLALIKETAKALVIPHLKAFRQGAAEAVADNQAALPNAGIPAGPGGGRIQKDKADMTPAEERDAVIAKTRGARQLGPDGQPKG